MRYLMILVFFAACLAAADITGAWIITSVDNNNRPTKGDLILKQEGDSFTARMKTATGVDIPLKSVRRDGDKVSFQFLYEDTPITINLAPDGDKLTGKWEASSGESAPVTCTRAVAAAAASSDTAITGKWNVAATRPEGDTMRLTLEIKDEGGKLTGSLSSDQGAIELAEMALNGSTLTFKVPSGGRAFAIKLEREGDGFKGTYTTPDGASGAVSLTR
jgi:hypothetical protein